MATKKYLENSAANESVSKYKLLSAYGGPGSLVHTQYGSIIISCIEEWGFLKRVLELNQKAVKSGKNEKDTIQYVTDEAKEGENGNIGIGTLVPGLVLMYGSMCAALIWADRRPVSES